MDLTTMTLDALKILDWDQAEAEKNIANNRLVIRQEIAKRLQTPQPAIEQPTTTENAADKPAE
jgi:hypothetical protein